jgi:hypothetical protein
MDTALDNGGQKEILASLPSIRRFQQADHEGRNIGMMVAGNRNDSYRLISAPIHDKKQ